MTKTQEILSKIIKNQKHDIPLDKKLAFKDLARISNNLPDDIFTDNCCIWSGYITNLNTEKKNCYISFFFKKKKVSLNRLLYCNFIGPLNDNEYIKYTCNNKGKCCSINHMKKVHEDNNENYVIKNINKEKKNSNKLRVSF